jgi:uncharacterized UPF0160 family protein
MSTYIGTSAETVYGEVQNRYFYGLRRTDNGELFLGKVDQLKAADTLTINKPGEPTENFPNFQEGQDFYEGRNVFHDLVYENLNYEQFRWDDRNVLYYINDEGELVLRVNQNHTYTDGDSSNGL